jgi:ADP-ribosylglycohydrolase/protein-tyrosine phosphatase
MNPANAISRKDRFRGALLGLAAGDAVGTTVEFKPRGSFAPVTDLVGGGPFALKPGQWTDDTSMALCLGQSLLDQCGFDPADQLKKYIRWWREGYMSSTDRCFDIGNTTRAALSRFTETAEPYCGSSNPQAAGNGSIMRLAPVPMFYLFDPVQALEKCALSSRTTHQASTAIDACRYFGALLAGALSGEDRGILLSDHYSPIPGHWEQHPLVSEIDTIAVGSFLRKSESEIHGSGYVVGSLEAALWAFTNSSSFAEGCLKAVNLGDDADTTWAVYGQLAGAFYGCEGIPAKWRNKLAKRDVLEEIAARLYCYGNRPHGNCYWVEPDRLMAGEYPGDKDETKAKEKVRRTVESGVTFFLDLTEPGEYDLKPYTPFLPEAAPNGKKVAHLRLAIPDTSVPEKRKMLQILNVIQNALADGHIVYLHCWGGVGRTGTVVGCWLRRSGMNGELALARIEQCWKAMSENKRQRRPESPEFESQKQFVRKWSEE